MYYGGDLFESEDEDDVEADDALSHVLLGAGEAVVWLIGGAVLGALLGTDLDSSPWFWGVLLALPLIVALALWLRRTRTRERLTFDLPERS